jgi:hypothetical protein
LFEESGTLELVAKNAAEWFDIHLVHAVEEQRTH